MNGRGRPLGAWWQRDQQHPVRQRQRPLPAWSPVRDLVPAALSYQPHQLAELARFQPGERAHPLRPRRCDHLHRTYAEDIAFDLVCGVEPTFDAAHGAALVHAGIGRTERGIFRFRSDAVLTRLAAARLLCAQSALPSSRDVVGEPPWQEVLVAAPRAGDPAFRAQLAVL